MAYGSLYNMPELKIYMEYSFVIKKQKDDRPKISIIGSRGPKDVLAAVKEAGRTKELLKEQNSHKKISRLEEKINE